MCIFNQCSETLRHAPLGSDLEKYCESLEGKYQREKISDESREVIRGLEKKKRIGGTIKIIYS